MYPKLSQKIEILIQQLDSILQTKKLIYKNNIPKTNNTHISVSVIVSHYQGCWGAEEDDSRLFSRNVVEHKIYYFWAD